MTNVEAALILAEEHHKAVFACHGIINGRCTCKRGANCSDPGKHPIRKGGFKNASTDPENVKEQWAGNPLANIGIATGGMSGFIAIDPDVRDGGVENWHRTSAKNGSRKLETVMADTGGGGEHVLFKYPGFYIGSRHDILPGIDVKGDGGYIIGSPSMHVSGRRYSWREGHGPGEVEIAPVPDWLMEVLLAKSEANLLAAAKGEDISSALSDLSGLSDLSVNGLERRREVQKLIRESIKISLPTGEKQRHKKIFELCRRLKGIQELKDVDVLDLKPIIQEWHRLALPVIRTKDFDPTYADFLDGWDRVLFAVGEASLDHVLDAALASGPPPGAESLPDQEIRLLAAICYQMQLAVGLERVFWLSCRDAGRLIGKSHTLASSFLRILCQKGLLEVVVPGTQKKGGPATRYRWTGPMDCPCVDLPTANPTHN